VYRYYFSYVPPSQRAGFGLAHGGEIGYVFGRSNANPEDAAISAAANAYWAAFAKTGDPGSAGGPAWPKYDLANEMVMEFGIDGVHVRRQLHNERPDWLEVHRAQVAASAAAGGTAAGAGRQN
jgi:para-nitrobenzyl esterase